jgi:hypothetical protein
MSSDWLLRLVLPNQAELTLVGDDYDGVVPRRAAGLKGDVEQVELDGWLSVERVDYDTWALRVGNLSTTVVDGVAGEWHPLDEVPA